MNAEISLYTEMCWGTMPPPSPPISSKGTSIRDTSRNKSSMAVNDRFLGVKVVNCKLVAIMKRNQRLDITLAMTPLDSFLSLCALPYQARLLRPTSSVFPTTADSHIICTFVASKAVVRPQDAVCQSYFDASPGTTATA